MALDDRISALATAVGTEIKEVRSEMALLGGGGGVQNLFIQSDTPSIGVGSKALWLQTGVDGSITFNLVEN